MSREINLQQLNCLIIMCVLELHIFLKKTRSFRRLSYTTASCQLLFCGFHYYCVSHIVGLCRRWFRVVQFFHGRNASDSKSLEGHDLPGIELQRPNHLPLSFRSVSTDKLFSLLASMNNSFLLVTHHSDPLQTSLTTVGCDLLSSYAQF